MRRHNRRVHSRETDLPLSVVIYSCSWNLWYAAILTKALTAKRLELLHELVPAATPIDFLVNPANPTVLKAEMMEAETAARTLGVPLVTLNASTLGEIEAAFEILVAQRTGALRTSGDPLWTIQRVQLAALTARHAVPAIYAVREIVDAGGLMSYGRTFPTPIGWSVPMPAAFSRVRSRPTCRCSRPPRSSSSSTSRPPRRSPSPSPKRCSPPPTR
jgi:hypothetical protein